MKAFLTTQVAGDAGVRLSSIIPPSGWSLTTDLYFPMQAVLLWATVAGVGWMSCNYGMAQRLLAAKSERDAQKALLLMAVLAVFYPILLVSDRFGLCASSCRKFSPMNR